MRYLIIFSAIACCLNASVQAQTSDLDLRTYAVKISTAPLQGEKAAAFIESIEKGISNNGQPIGLYYSGEPVNVSSPVLEITNATTKKVIATVLLSDLLKGVKNEVSEGNSRYVSTFTIGSSSNKIEIQNELLLMTDEGMPSKQKRVVNIQLRISKSAKITARLNLKALGSVRLNGTSGITISRTEKGEAQPPILSLINLKAAKINIGKRDNKTGFQPVSWESSIVNADDKTWSSLFSFGIAGSTIDNYEKALAQINHAAARLTTGEATPELVIVITADKKSTAPGDTVTYTIVYENIGSAFAKDVQITNPIPDGVKLIESSVEGGDNEVQIERKPVPAPQIGDPTLVRWKIKNSILPGEEGKVTMKVVVE